MIALKLHQSSCPGYGPLPIDADTLRLMHVCRKYSSKSYSPWGYGDKKSDEFTFPAKCGSYVKVSDMQRLHCSSIVEAFVHSTAGYSDPEGARTVWCI